MNKKTAVKIAFSVLFIHGFIEVSGAVMLLALPIRLLATAGFQDGGTILFMAALSAICGLSRIVAGYEIRLMKKWGIVFGIVLSIATMIGSSSIYPFGVMDLLLATIVLVSLLYTWFGSETLFAKTGE
ncbi:MAG: hypothetical protein KKE04_03990 [Candidatus Thermoplasmatota archaeon]|nr:hypothetical protein [Candidatus Thermoplasmatota archaeon]